MSESPAVRPARGLNPPGMSMTGPATSPLRAFLRTEAASASVLVAAITLALVWANLMCTGYDAFWAKELPIRIGRASATWTYAPGSTTR
ncbi:Na+/H+ antiporter NhaA [Kribbella sp. NPDC026596]|uniref:Na+/H+ antiporter NhaA n=1 Tax=Kribbella sp. NPDC026596 TaxID=3155122 RepID=UPI0033C70AEA